MKTLFVTLIFVMLSLVIASPALAQAGDVCPNHDMATIQALINCFQHASTQGIINDPGITESLLAKLNAAKAAVNRDQPEVAVNILQAFVSEVQAQAGKHIPAMHAAHLVQHTQSVINDLE